MNWDKKKIKLIFLRRLSREYLQDTFYAACRNKTFHNCAGKIIKSPKKAQKVLKILK